MQKSIISQGAEAILELQGDLIIKRRIAKTYRYPHLDDKLRKTRTRKEAKLLLKASKLIPVPLLVSSSDVNMEISMSYLPGQKLSDTLESLPSPKDICFTIGKQIALLHDAGIIHGDLTTSNMIFFQKKVYFIDFGLGFESDNPEDKAVDLHLIRQALEARHFEHFEEYFEAILEGYRTSRNAPAVLKRLEKVEQRGRYKQAY